MVSSAPHAGQLGGVNCVELCPVMSIAVLGGVSRSGVTGVCCSRRYRHMAIAEGRAVGERLRTFPFSTRVVPMQPVE